MPPDLEQIGRGGLRGLFQAYVPSRDRIVVFIGPYIALGCGFLTTWAARQLRIAGRDPRGEDLAGLGGFLAGTAVTWAMLDRWLRGWQMMEAEERSRLDERLPYPIPPSPDVPPPNRDPNYATAEDTPQGSDTQ